MDALPRPVCLMRLLLKRNFMITAMPAYIKANGI